MLTTSQVASKLGISVRRVQLLIKSGQLPAERVGQRMLLVKESDLKLVAVRKAGRPRGEKK